MMQGKEWRRYLELMQERPECFRNNGPIRIICDWAAVDAYQRRTGITIGVCYESMFNILVVDLVCEGEGNCYAYERILPAVARGAVVSVTQYQGNYVLLRQYRHAMRDFQYAFPRGFATEGLSGEENARKETEEELGAVVKRTEYLGSVVADSGLAGQKVQIYRCEIENYCLRDEYEGIVDVCTVSEAELFEMIRNEQISDGFTLAACSYLAVAKA